MTRAYSLINIKAFDEEAGTITGIATTPTPDRADDIVVPEGVKFQLPIPLLWQHNSGQPIGNVTDATVTKDGIQIVAQIARGVTDEIDRAWKLIKAGLVRGLSIGFRGLETAQIEGSWGVKYLSWEWIELSAVTIPANAEASISTVKSLSNDANRTPVVKPKPVSLKEQKTMKTIAEHIAALEAKRAASTGRMNEIMQKGMETGRSTEADEQEEFDALETDVATIDGDLKRFRALEKAQLGAARPVTGGRQEEGADSRNLLAPVKVKAAKLAPGIEFARLARAKAIAQIDHEPARVVAKRLYGEESMVTGLLEKANVVAGSSISGTWAADLVLAEGGVIGDFAEFLRPMTILGKFGTNGIPSLRNIPFRTALLTQTGGGTGYWVGEGKPKPLTNFDWDKTTLDELKVAAITVVTEELLRKSTPSADQLLRDSLAAALTARIDLTFIDPAIAASAGVSPASITNGVSAIASTGNDADAIREDLRALWGTFIAANNPPTTAVYVMSSLTALALSLMVNPLGQPEFPGINMNGGFFQGIPVITSQYLADVSAGGFVVLVNASDIYFGDEGGVNVDVSREASLQMLDNPTNDSVTPTATSMVSLWQTDSVAFRGERVLNWKKRRTSAVALLDEVEWGQPGS